VTRAEQAQHAANLPTPAKTLDSLPTFLLRLLDAVKTISMARSRQTKQHWRYGPKCPDHTVLRGNQGDISLHGQLQLHLPTALKLFMFHKSTSVSTTF